TATVPKESAAASAATPAAEPVKAAENEQYDIVIAGAGAAGMTAALNAYKTGAKNILLIEKLSVVGGGTTCATGGMHACDTKAMKKLDNKETMVDMFETAVRRGVGVGSTQAYGLYIGAATSYVDWLLDCGYDFWDIHYGDLHKPSDKSLARRLSGFLPV
ncbi:MAG: FAD-binding protein, partial [Oscillospiraceae bacterium]